jgi:uncharacterized protein (TIGR03086 family)
MDVVATLRDQAAQTTKLVRSVQPDQLRLPTPCAAWDVRALLNHLCIVAQFCARVARGERAEPEYETDFLGDDPAGAYERWRDEMLEACSAPDLPPRSVFMAGNEMPGAVVLALALMDTVVHRWDLARALGAEPGIDPEVASFVLEQVRPWVPDELRASAPDRTTGSVPIGPVVEVPEAAPRVDQLVAFLGRTP